MNRELDRYNFVDRMSDFLKHSKLVLTAIGLVLIILLGVFDYLTGPEISLSVFYLLPISLITWFADRRSGVILSIISAFTWLTADLATQPTYLHPLIPYWNAIVRLLFFIVIVFLESALKSLHQDLENKVEERTALLAEEVVERKTVEERLQQYLQRLEILHGIEQAILAAHSIEAVGETTVLNVKSLLSCDRVSFMLLDFELQQVIFFDTSKDTAGEKVFQERIPMDKLIDFNAVLESFQNEDVQLINDLANSPIVPAVAKVLQTRDYRSLIIAPILVHNELFGCLSLMAFDPYVFLPGHLEIGREVANLLGIFITQARMIDQLRTGQENLQALSQQLLQVQEAERRKIARELHDEIGQELTGLALTLQMASRVQTTTVINQLSQAQAIVVELMDRVSRLSLELRPAMLDDLGLLPTLLWYIDLYSFRTNIKVMLKHSGLENRRFATEVETAGYRIVQEGLTNVARHAQVTEAKVTLWYDQGVLGVQVEDEGIGFDPDIALAESDSSGLFGMQERAMLLGGKLVIESPPGKGTRLLAEIPVNEAIVIQGYGA